MRLYEAVTWPRATMKFHGTSCGQTGFDIFTARAPYEISKRSIHAQSSSIDFVYNCLRDKMLILSEFACQSAIHYPTTTSNIACSRAAKKNDDVGYLLRAGHSFNREHVFDHSAEFSVAFYSCRNHRRVHPRWADGIHANPGRREVECLTGDQYI